MEEILYGALRSPIESPAGDHATLELELVVRVHRTLDPLDVGRWEGEGGAPATGCAS